MPDQPPGPPGPPATSLGPGDPTPAKLVALSRDIERTDRRMTQLDALVRELGEKVTALTDGLHTDSPEPGDPTQPTSTREPGRPVPAVGVRSWLLVENHDRAVTDLADLISWLDRVYLAYPNTVLATCWMWHPDAVEELWWLYQAHLDAYHPTTGNWLRVADWHDRLRPNVVKRIRAANVACELSEHRPGREHDRPTNVTPMAGSPQTIAAWAVAGRPYPAPHPTEAELAESERIYKQLYHGKRR